MIRAYIREDFVGRFLAVALIRETDGMPRQILRIEETTGPHTVYRWEDLPDQLGPDIPPTLEIGDSEARALLETLTRHYSGAEDTRALRRDYDAERARVDRLTTTLGMIVRNLTGNAEAVLTEQQWRRIKEASDGPD